MKRIKRILSLFLTFILSFSLIACSDIDLDLVDTNDLVDIEEDSSDKVIDRIDEDGSYTSKEDVALYIHTYEKLPENFITKRQAGELGWKSSEGNLWDVTDKMSIGGDKFGNREKLLPVKQGRQYYECDINYEGKYRGAERLVFSEDGLIYYTSDHYNSFELLYGEE